MRPVHIPSNWEKKDKRIAFQCLKLRFYFLHSAGATISNKFYKENVCTTGAHCRQLCARRRKFAPRALGAPLISNTAFSFRVSEPYCCGIGHCFRSFVSDILFTINIIIIRHILNVMGYSFSTFPETSSPTFCSMTGCPMTFNFCSLLQEALLFIGSGVRP